MELAFHLRTLDQRTGFDEVPQQLRGLYHHVAPAQKKWLPDFPSSVARVYLGDEFCPHRLPTLGEFRSVYQSFEKRRLGITLLTPPFTDEELKNHISLFDYLRINAPETEVVVNDWGTLSFFRAQYPQLPLAAGRLFNKGFKDPRLADIGRHHAGFREMKALLAESTFDHSEVREKLLESGVMRLERDLLPYGKVKGNGDSRLALSIYFPFGYITTGRICWLATFRQEKQQKFIPVKHCTQPCTKVSFQLKSSDFSFPIVQSGNTVFYLYSPAMVRSLLRMAQREEIRLVYQGLALGTS